jgi:hypothetical protein
MSRIRDALHKSWGGPEGRGGESHVSHRAPTKTLTEPVRVLWVKTLAA